MPRPTVSNTTLEYIDGFDDYITSQLTRYWNAVYGNIAIGAGNGRNGTNALQSGNYQSCVQLVLTPQVTRTVGFAFRLAASPVNNDILFALVDGTTNQLDFRIMNAGLINVTRNGTVLATTSQGLNMGQWYFIEFTSVLSTGSTGSFILRVNQTNWASGSGIQTAATPNNFAAIVQLLFNNNNGGNNNYIFDDFYSRADGVFCGDSQVFTGLPVANGFVNNFTRGGTDSGTNWGQVKDNPADDDNTYIQSPNPGDIDLYTYPAMPFAAGSTVFGVMPCPVLKNDVGGTCTAVPEYRSGGTNYDGTLAQQVAPANYNAYPDIQGRDPATNNPWTVAGVNAAQFGIKRVG
jgi:hypothetical protein